MDELLKKIEEMNLTVEEQTHWEYVISKYLDKHMPIRTMTNEDFRFLKDNGWYVYFCMRRSMT